MEVTMVLCNHILPRDCRYSLPEKVAKFLGLTPEQIQDLPLGPWDASARNVAVLGIPLTVGYKVHGRVLRRTQDRFPQCHVAQTRQVPRPCLQVQKVVDIREQIPQQHLVRHARRLHGGIPGLQVDIRQATA